MTTEQLKSLPTQPPKEGGKYRADIAAGILPPSCQVWEHRRVGCGNLASFYISTHPPVVHCHDAQNIKEA